MFCFSVYLRSVIRSVIQALNAIPPRSTTCLPTRLDEPEPGVDASGDLGEDVSRIGVLQFARLLAGVACMFAKGGQRRRKRINVAVPMSGSGTNKQDMVDAEGQSVFKKRSLQW